MIDVNKALSEALKDTGIGASEAPYKPQDDGKPYITWLANPEEITYASGQPRFRRIRADVVIWVPDGMTWHELLLTVRTALTDAGIRNGFEGVAYIDDAKRKAVKITARWFESL